MGKADGYMVSLVGKLEVSPVRRDRQTDMV